MKRRALLILLALCIATFGNGGTSMFGFGISTAWADGDDGGDSGSDSGGDSGGDDGGDSGGGNNRGSANSGNQSDNSGLSKYDSILDAVSKKRILPLSLVKVIVIARYGTNIVDVEIDKKRGRWIYEFKMINRASRLIKVYVDARSGKITKVEND